MSNGGGGGQAAAIEAGRASVRLGADQAGLKSDLDKARRMVLGWGKSIAAVGGGLLGAGGSLLGGIGAAFSAAVDKFDAVGEAAARLGTSTEAISELGYAFSKAGASMEEVEAAGKFLNKNLALNADAFEQFGIDAAKLQGMELGEQFEVIADAIAGMDKEMQTGAAMSLLGKGGSQLLPLLKKGSAELRAQRDIAREVGASINSLDAENADKVADAMADSWAAVKNTFIAVGAALLPQADRLVMIRHTIVTLVGTVREFINNNREMVLGITLGSAAVAAAGVALIALGGSLAVATFAVGGFMSAFAAAGAVIGAILSPVGLAVVGLAAAGLIVASLVADFADLTPIVETFGAAWTIVADLFKQTWQGIKDAMSGGDMKLALEIGVAGLNVVWKGFLLVMQGAWNAFKDDFVDGWHGAIVEIKVLFGQFTRWMQEQMKGVAETKFGRNLGLQDFVLRGTDSEDATRAIGRLDQKDRDRARMAEMEKAKAELRKAKEELDALTKKAGDLPGRDMLPMPREVKANIIAAVSELGTSRGGFGGQNASARFGVGNVQEKQLKELEGIHREVKKKGAGIPVE